MFFQLCLISRHQIYTVPYFSVSSSLYFQHFYFFRHCLIYTFPPFIYFIIISLILALLLSSFSLLLFYVSSYFQLFSILLFYFSSISSWRKAAPELLLERRTKASWCWTILALQRGTGAACPCIHIRKFVVLPITPFLASCTCLVTHFLLSLFREYQFSIHCSQITVYARFDPHISFFFCLSLP